MNAEKENAEQSYCVFNKTRESFLSLSVVASDTQLARLKGLIGRLKLKFDEGIWVIPSKGVHTIGVLFAIDLIYLDRDHRVIHVKESFGTFRIGPIRKRCSSVLELPTRTIYSSQTQLGDELLICSPREMEQYLEEIETRKNHPPAPIREAAPPRGRSAMGFLDWLKQALRQEERAVRHTAPGIVAYFWDGGVPKEHALKNISLTGAYLYATERWSAGTILTLTLQEAAQAGETAAAVSHHSVRCRVIRQTPDGMAVAFVFLKPEERQALKRFMNRAVTSTGKATPHANRRMAASGQALVELALIVPLVFLMMVNIANFGVFFYDWITVANAARAGAQYAALGAHSVQTPAPATLCGVQTLVQNETQSLPHWSASITSSPSACTTATGPNPVITVCQNNAGTVTKWGGGTCAAGSGGTCPVAGALPPCDPEGSTYTTLRIDVTYTFTPLIAAFRLPTLGIGLPTLPSTINAHTVMRILN